MSRSPHFFVERYNNHTKKYELQHPIVWNFDHTKTVTAELYPYNGDHELFAIVEETSDTPMRGIHAELPEDCCTEIKTAYDDCCYDIDYDGKVHHIAPAARWFTYADMYIYCLEHPETIDWSAVDELDEEQRKSYPMKPTQMKALKDRIDAFLEVMNLWGWGDDYSLIRIVYWIG